MENDNYLWPLFGDQIGTDALGQIVNFTEQASLNSCI
jgi:hypothetical protein